MSSSHRSIQQSQHSRNDSTFSMDSFVADMPESQDGDEGDAVDVSDAKFEYISSIESNERNHKSNTRQGTEPFRESVENQIEPESMVRGSDDRTTVSRPGSIATDGDLTVASESSGPIPPPVHSFFNQPYFQTESSLDDAFDGGSIVFNNSHDSLVSSHQRPPNHQQQSINIVPHSQNQKSNQPTRDRFPSYDSVGSSGSVVRHLPGGQNSKATKTSMSSHAPSVQRILPYHERRKLQQQQRSQGPSGPPRPDRQQLQQMPNSPSSTSIAPLPMSHSQQSHPQPDQVPYPSDMILCQQQNSFVHGAMPMYLPNVSIPFPPYSSVPMQQPIVTPIHPGFYGQYPPPQIQMQSVPTPFDQIQRPGLAPLDRPPATSGPNKNQMMNNSRGLQPNHYNAQSRPPVQRSFQQKLEPGTGALQEFVFGNNNGVPTFDSSDDNDESKNVRAYAAFTAKRSTSPPPPPPSLPPPVQAAHLRQYSNGSVSSLGSLDRSIRDESAETRASSSNFFQRWNPWSSNKDSVTDFHRKNRAFLSAVGTRSKSKLPPHVTTNALPKVSAQSAPPPSRGGHRKLSSIDNDDWTETEQGEPSIAAQIVENSSGFLDYHVSSQQTDVSLQVEVRSTSRRSDTVRPHEDSDSISSNLSSSRASDGDNSTDNGIKNRDEERPADERTRLLPPSGISSNEHYDSRHYESTDKMSYRSEKKKRKQRVNHDVEASRLPTAVRSSNQDKPIKENSGKRDKKSKKHRRRQRRSSQDVSESSSSISSSTASSRNRPQKVSKRVIILERERRKLYKQWKAEASAEAEAHRVYQKENRWFRRFGKRFTNAVTKGIVWSESFFANMPLTIGSIAVANATMGVDWFKFAEESLTSCRPVHFHSAQCTFPEFPGCFYCDTSSKPYAWALIFHHMCSTFAGVLALFFFAKFLVARRVFFDDLRSPTMAAPAGNVCITLVIVFAGHGTLGMFAVLAASSIHLCIAVWFIYMALAYHMMPDPSWFPNTTSIGICAVKTWLYNPIAGQLLMAISLSLNFLLFPVSLIRVLLNNKISAPVSWMQMSAPDISLYALTIMGQPSFEEELPDINYFQKVHRMVYLPIMHFLFVLCLIGMLASLNGLRARWSDFRRLPFSPAHAAFCAPTLSHANAVQAYRAAINSFSNLPHDGWFRKCLYTYWITVLICGTMLTVYITIRFLLNLPGWTHFNVDGEIEPPAPNETAMTLTNMVSAGETLVQPYISPAVLQANETGALVLVNDASGHRYVRTRQVTALGFDPILNVIQIERERDLLLDWVGKNPPRSRSHTLSVPGIDFNYRSTFGTGNSGVYDCEDSNAPWTQRPRSPLHLARRKNTLISL